MRLRVLELWFCLASLPSGGESMYFLEWMQNRFLPMLNGTAIGSVVTLYVCEAR